MNALSRHFAAAWALIGVFVTVQAGAQAPVTPGTAPAAPSWGVFDKLAGQELKSNDGGYTIRFSWVRPGEELLQEWVHPSSGKVVGTAVTVRDPVTGQLREGKTVAASAKGYLGTTGSDGSVAFLKGKSGYRWQLAADGFVERVDLKLAGSTVVAKPAVPYARWALPVAPPPTVAASARPAGTSAPTPQVLSGPSRVTELPLGITAPGKLAADAEVDAEGRPYRCYSFTAAAGTSIKATVSSKEFQPLVRLARGSLCGSARVSREVESQRGAAELSEQIAAGGNYVLLVGSRTPGATGRFQLALEGTEAPMAAAETPEVAAAAGAARVASTGGGSRAAAPSSRAAAMQAQTAAYQAELDRRAEEERLRRAREAEAARVAAAEARAAQERRAATFMAVMNGVAQVGAAYLEARNGGGGGMGGGLSGVAGQAMAAAKPNVVDGGACSKVTASNYRTEALVKDGDTQLRTMCGAAHEYYNVYLNALKQGYSEADADRSYQAHVQAATTAASYAQTHRAN